MLTFIHYNTLNSASWVGRPQFLNLSETKQVPETVQRIKSGWKMWCHKGQCHSSVTPCSTSDSSLAQRRKADDSCCSFQESKYRTCERLAFISSSSVSFQKKEEIVFLFPVMSYIYALQSRNVWENLRLSPSFLSSFDIFFEQTLKLPACTSWTAAETRRAEGKTPKVSTVNTRFLLTACVYSSRSSGWSARLLRLLQTLAVRLKVNATAHGRKEEKKKRNKRANISFFGPSKNYLEKKTRTTLKTFLFSQSVLLKMI